MHFGIYLPNFGTECSPRSLADLASAAEAAGWDGFFLWDHMLASKSQKLPIVDPWITLAAAATQTERIRLGTTVTPVARRRPWKLARETASLDGLSNGRVVLGVGLGEPADADFEFFGESGDGRVRAAKLDEGLDILAGLWSGKPFSYQGTHYKIPHKVTFLPAPQQKPRIPSWVGGFWPNKPPFRRAARWDGMIPLKQGGWVQPEDIVEILEYVRCHRLNLLPLDVAVIGTRNALGNKPAKVEKELGRYQVAGVTWWLEAFYMERNSNEALMKRAREGPG